MWYHTLIYYKEYCALRAETRIMKRSNTGVVALHILLDAAFTVLSMALAFWVRFELFGGSNPVGGFPYHMLWSGIFAPVFVLIFSFLGVYTPHPSRGYIHDFGKIVLGNTLGVMLYIDVVFVFRVVDFSRWMILLFYLFMIVLTGARGFIWHRVLRRKHRRGEGLRELVIIGDGHSAQECFAHLTAHPDAGIRVVGSIGDRAIPGLPRISGYTGLRSALDRVSPDEAVIAVDENRVSQLGGILRQCENTGVKLALLPVCWEYMSRHPYFEDFCDIPIMNVRRVALDDFGKALVKRVMDVVLSLLMILLTAPIMLVAVIGTRISSPGPILFRQERIGKDRKPFSMLKFRSMRVNTASDSAWTRDGDPRRTRFGAFMRRYSIDELPQLFNVLRGDMSLVGPRPEIPKYVDHFKYSIPLYMVRHQVRPGITGWAQVNGLRGDTSIQKRVDFDLFYIENWSVFFDLKILLMTPFKGIVNHQESLVKNNISKEGKK